MTQTTCSVVEDGTRCDRVRYGHGLCSKHWKRWYKHGDPLYIWVREVVSPEERLERTRARSRRYQAAHPERRRESGRKYANANPEYERARRQKFREANPGWHREWASRNPQRAQAYSRKWREAHPEVVIEMGRRWKATHPEILRQRSHERRALKAGIRMEPYDMLDIFDRDNWTCYLCGQPIDPSLPRKSHPMAATLDHIIPITMPGTSDTPDNVKAAHRSCNSVKKTGTVEDARRRLGLL